MRRTDGVRAPPFPIRRNIVHTSLVLALNLSLSRRLAVMTPAFLLLIALQFSLHSSVSAITCSPADSGGECRAFFSLSESRCLNDERNYAAMRTQCCSMPSPSQECCEYDCLTSSEQWSHSLPPSQASLPHTAHNLTLSPAPVDCSTFSLTASWPAIGNVTGYTIVIYRRHRLDVVAQYTTSNPMNTAITLPSLCYSLRSNTLNFELWKRIAGTSDHELVARSSVKRKNCYTLYSSDLTTQHRHCGPQISDQVDRSEVKVRSESAGGRVFTTAVHWPPMTGVHSYVLRLIYNNQYLWFNASDTNGIIFTDLNQPISMRIQPYMDCAGMYFSQDMWVPCASSLIHIPVPSPETHMPSSIVMDTITSSSELPPSLYSTPTSAPTVEHPPILTSAPSTSSLPSTTHTSPQPELTVGLAVSVTVLLILFLALSLCLLVRHKNQQPRKKPPSLLTLPPPRSPTPPSSLSSPGTTPSGYIPYPNEFSSYPSKTPPTELVLPRPSHSVWILYSLDTPDDQKRLIHEKLKQLSTDYGISLHTPGTIASRNITREWLVTGTTQASAVLLVCNRQFYEEWRTDSSDCCRGVKIGREIRVLMNNVNPDDLAKYACVHFEKTEQEFEARYSDLLGPYITRHFSLTENRDKLVESIAKFVHNLPEFEFGSVY